MSVQNRDQLVEVLQKHRSEFRDLGVQRFGLFGSFSKDLQDDKSDIDLLVDFDAGKKSFDRFMELSFLLEDLLGRKVDLLTRESLSPYIGQKILAEVEYGLID
jgi:predicted nucleotidyltransferase